MIEIEITKDMRDSVYALINHMGTHKARNALTDKRMEVGYMGEEAVQSILKAKRENTYEYDFIVDGVRIDVKTKASKYPPRGSYDVSIYPQQKYQNTDYYAFMRIDDQYEKAWLLGIVSKDVFFDNAFVLKKGVPQSNGLIPKSDSYNMSIDDVWKYSEHEKFL
jgi:hypothetical protein